jgi:hypothetical protein
MFSLPIGCVVYPSMNQAEQKDICGGARKRRETDVIGMFMGDLSRIWTYQQFCIHHANPVYYGPNVQTSSDICLIHKT